MVTESVAPHSAFGVTDVALAIRRRRLRRELPPRVTINNSRQNPSADECVLKLESRLRNRC